MDARQEREYRKAFSGAATGRQGGAAGEGTRAPGDDPLGGLRSTASSTQLRVSHAVDALSLAAQAEKLEKVAKRWMNMGVGTAFASWREEATTARRTRRLMTKTLTRMLNVSKRKAFKRWKMKTRQGRPWRATMARLDAALARFLEYPAWLRARRAAKSEDAHEALGSLVAQYPHFLTRGEGTGAGTLAHTCVRNDNAQGLNRLRRLSEDPGFLFEVRDSRGRSPLDLAVKLKHSRIADAIFSTSGNFVDSSLNLAQREMVFFQGYAEFEQYHAMRVKQKEQAHEKTVRKERMKKRFNELKRIFGIGNTAVAPDGGEGANEGEGADDSKALAM